MQGSDYQKSCEWTVQNPGVSLWAAGQGEEKNRDRDPTQLLRLSKEGV